MKDTKEKKAKVQITISALILTVVLIAELYLMIADQISYVIIPIIGLGIVALAVVFMLVNAIMTIANEREVQRQAHFENLYKSEKASYIMMKNKFEEIDARLAIMQEVSKIPTEEIINAQKGIAKVIINRSKENADAIINSNDQVLERLDEIDETQNTKFTGISKDQRLKLTEMSNQTELKLQDMVVQLKDMELRLNQAIMQGGGTKVVYAEPGTVITKEPSSVEEFPITEDVLVTEELPNMEESLIAEELANMEESLIAEELANMEESLIAEEVPNMEESLVTEKETPVLEELRVAEAAPEIDLSDPNKAMSADDIAALFASMAGGNTEEETEPEILEEPVVEDVPPMPDLSDPNRQLSPDEIAALIANL